MNRRDVSVTLPWMGAGTEFLDRVVDSLPDDALTGPSALPGWSRAHVIGHLARNAEALTRLLSWARTGVETPMYADAEQRNAEIESSAARPGATLRQELVDTARDLDAAVAALDPDRWDAQVRTAQGRAVPAAEVPWMRVREVWLHAVDLDAGATVADLPPEVVDALLDDVTAALTARPGCPAVRLAPDDRDRSWTLGTDGGPTLHGAAADLMAWLVGRPPLCAPTTGGGVPVPDAPRWI